MVLCMVRRHKNLFVCSPMEKQNKNNTGAEVYRTKFSEFKKKKKKENIFEVVKVVK